MMFAPVRLPSVIEKLINAGVFEGTIERAICSSGIYVEIYGVLTESYVNPPEAIDNIEILCSANHYPELLRYGFEYAFIGKETDAKTVWYITRGINLFSKEGINRFIDELCLFTGLFKYPTLHDATEAVFSSRLFYDISIMEKEYLNIYYEHRGFEMAEYKDKLYEYIRDVVHKYSDLYFNKYNAFLDKLYSELLSKFRDKLIIIYAPLFVGEEEIRETVVTKEKTYEVYRPYKHYGITLLSRYFADCTTLNAFISFPYITQYISRQYFELIYMLSKTRGDELLRWSPYTAIASIDLNLDEAFPEVNHEMVYVILHTLPILYAYYRFDFSDYIRAVKSSYLSLQATSLPYAIYDYIQNPAYYHGCRLDFRDLLMIFKHIKEVIT